MLKAHRKLKADENTVDRAKKALAIALTLLDETGGEHDAAGVQGSAGEDAS